MIASGVCTSQDVRSRYEFCETYFCCFPGKNTLLWSSFTGLAEEDKVHTDYLLDELYGDFVDKVCFECLRTSQPLDTVYS